MPPPFKKVIAMGMGEIEDREREAGHVVGGQSLRQRAAAPKRRHVDGEEFTANFGFVTQAVSRKLLPANPRRTYLLIQNNSAGIMYINFGAKGDAFSGVQIAANGYYEPYRPPKGDISVLGSAANLNGVVVETVRTK